MMQDDVDQRQAVAGVSMQNKQRSKATSKKPKTASSSSADFETTFDVDGNVETIAGQPPIDNQSALLLILF